MITHPKEIESLKLNQKFKQGEYILNDGSTGNSTGDHIDIEIAVYKNKKDIKTTWYLNKGNYRLTKSVNPCNYMVLNDNVKIISNTYKNKKYIMKKISSIYNKGFYKTLYNMNIRKNASVNSKVIGKLNKNKTFEAISIIVNNKDDIWAKTTKGYINIVNNKNLNCMIN